MNIYVRRNSSYALFLFLLLLLSSCKNNNKIGITEDNPIFNEPVLKEITTQIHQNPEDASLYFKRGIILKSIGVDTLALKDFNNAIKLDSTKANYFSMLGDLLFEHKDVSGSLPYLLKAIKLNPKDPTAHLKVAKLNIFLKDYTKAFAEINIVLRQNTMMPEGYFLKGMIYKDLSDTTKAMSSFLTAVQVDPTYKDAIFQLGLMMSQKKDSTALKYFDNAFKADSTDVYPLYAKGMFYQNIERFEQAKSVYTNCILHEPNFSDAYFNIGWILMQQDSFEKAARHFDIVAKLEPTDASAYYNKGLCYELMNQKSKALEEYKQAIVFDKNYKEAKEGIQRLSKTNK